MRLLRSLDEESWRHFVDNQPASNVFHTPEMFQVFEQAKGHQPTLWAVTDSDRQVLALFLPVQIRLVDGLVRRLTTRAVAYGSVLYGPSAASEEALTALLRAYTQDTKHDVVFTELRNLSDLNAVRSLLNDCGFVHEDHLNYLIDLNRPLEQVMEDIGKRTRKHIRRGLRKQAVIVEDVTGRNQVKVCYDLFQKTYSRAQVPLADFSLFEAAYDILHPQDMIKFWLARVGEAYVAASAELLYKDVMYGWYGGTDRAYASYMAGELLMWHILKWGVENGYKTYDFGGAGKPGEEYGVRDFKAKFGGQLVNFGRHICVHSPLALTLSRIGYQVYRKVMATANAQW